MKQKDNIEKLLDFCIDSEILTAWGSKLISSKIKYNIKKDKKELEEFNKDEISDMLISSLPSDAENLLTLTGWQAQEVVKNFLNKLN